MTPDGDDTRIIARAMASSTAGGILRSFQGKEMTASDIASALNIPIPTIMYHLDALLEAGLIEVSRIRYSVKGREVKVYRQSDKVFIVAPCQANLRETLLKYASLFGVTILVAGIAALFSPLHPAGSLSAFPGLREMKETGVFTAVANNPAEIVSDSAQALGGNAQLPLSSAPCPVTVLSGIPDIATGILIGGSLIIGVLMVIELVSAQRKKR